MNVRELIEALQLLNPELEVVTRGYEDGWNPASMATVIKVVANKSPQYYNGKYESMDDEVDFKDTMNEEYYNIHFIGPVFEVARII
jgi:hypothetical protein